MRHYEEETLILYTLAPKESPNSASILQHLRTCDACDQRLRTIRRQLEHEQPLRRQRLEDILDSEAQTTDEEDRATRLLTSTDHEALAQALATLGGVRALVRALPDLRFTAPLRALHLAELGLECSEALNEQQHTPTAIAHLRGVLWKEYANTLRVLGRFQDALQALDHAEDQLSAALLEWERAGVWYVRAATLREIDELELASLWLAEAQEVFRRYGDATMEHRAAYLYAAILYRQHRYQEAQEAFRELVPQVTQEGDEQTLAMLHNALGQVAIDLQDFPEAKAELTRALELYGRLGLGVEILRIRWGLARLQISAGHIDEGINTLRDVQAACRARNLTDDEHLVGLDLTDALLARNRAEEAAKVCDAIVTDLRTTDSMPNLLRAAEYLREAARQRKATRTLVKQVRLFFEEASKSPQREFQPTN